MCVLKLIFHLKDENLSAPSLNFFNTLKTKKFIMKIRRKCSLLVSDLVSTSDSELKRHFVSITIPWPKQENLFYISSNRIYRFAG